MRVVIEGYDEAIESTLKNVALNLRWRREQLGMSFRELSQVTGMEISGLNRIFKGHKEWYPSTLVKIGFALDADPADFWKPHAEFRELYAGRAGDGPLVLRLSRDSLRSNPPSSSASPEAERAGNRRAAASGKAVKKGSSKSANGTKDSPFRQPAPLTVVVTAPSPEPASVAA